MIHDQRNRLTEYRSGGSTLASYQYSGRGERVAKTQGAATQRFVYDEAGRLIYETGSGSPRTYLRSDDAPIAVIDGTALTGYIVPDNLGTPRAITNSAGTAIWRWDQVTGSTTTGGSAVFGQGAANTDPDGNGTHLTFNPRFPGQYFDAESGLHYNYFRHYEPLTGRYVQSDPIGLDIDISTYSYARTKTLNTVDPFGLYGDVDRALLQCYTSGGCDSFDISRSCNDYLRDPLISTWRTRAKTTARAKVRQRIPIVGPFSFSKKGGAENYVTTIYSMASGYDNWELSCTGASDGCCASADCTFRLWRIDRFEDVYDLGQNTGTDPSGFLANFGGEGTPFTFYINCRDTFSVKECKE
jgi:RHS repeat-associated protein